MKKILLLGSITAILFTGCFQKNFTSYSEWKKDKSCETKLALVLESNTSKGFIEGKAKIYSTGEIVNFTQKPYLYTNVPFKVGTSILVSVDKNGKSISCEQK